MLALCALALLAASGRAMPSLDRVLDRLKTGTPAQSADAMARLAQFAADPMFDVGMVRDCLPVVVRAVRAGTAEQQEKAAGFLLNLASVPRNREVMVHHFAIKPLVDLLRHDATTSPAAKRRAAGALQNLSAYPPARVAIAKVGGIGVLIAAARHYPIPCHATLHNIAQHRDLKAIMLEKGYAPRGTTFDPAKDTEGDERPREVRQVYFRREPGFVRPPKAEVVYRSTEYIVDERGVHERRKGKLKPSELPPPGSPRPPRVRANLFPSS